MKRYLLIVFFAIFAKLLNAQVINPYFISYPTWCKELEEEAILHPYAQVTLGYYYLEGNGVKINYEKAVYWFNKSLTKDNQDIGRAYNNLGYCYEHGLGVNRNIEKAFNFYSKAAYNKDNSSYVNLAEGYENGKGISVNIDSALVWYKKGIKFGSRTEMRKAYVRCGYIYAFEKKKVQTGIEYLEKAISYGSGAALYYMGEIYDQGIGDIEKNPHKAVSYYKESLDTELYPFVLTILANHYYEGNGVQKDVDKAIELYEDAAKKGDLTAKEKLKQIGR